MTTRLNVNLNTETADAIRRLMASQGRNATETIRRAIAVYSFLEQEAANGRHIHVVGKGETREITIL